jgi:hypothetical protein
MASYDDDYRREVLDLVRDLATTRFAPQVRDGLPFFLRTQSRLVVDDNLDGLVAYSEWLDAVRLAARVSSLTWRDGNLSVAIAATLQIDDQPLRFEADGSDWLLPASAAPGVDRGDRLVSARDLDDADLDCATISRADSQLWSTTDGLALSITDAGEVRIAGEVVLDLAALEGGRPLTAGLWDLRLRVTFGGIAFGCPLRPAGEPPTLPAWLSPGAEDSRAVQPFWTSPEPTLSLDIDEWSHPLTDLIDDAVEPSLDRRDFNLEIAALTGPRSSLHAQLLLVGDPADKTSASIPATLTISPTGAALAATILRGLDGSELQIWVRIGQPGGSPARRLAWRLVGDGRGLTVVSSSGVHLR